jgi:hypothetical protein
MPIKEVRYDRKKGLLKAARKLADKTADTLFIYHFTSSGEQYVWSTDPELPNKFFRGEFRAEGHFKVQNDAAQSCMKVKIVRPPTGPDDQAAAGSVEMVIGDSDFASPCKNYPGTCMQLDGSSTMATGSQLGQTEENINTPREETTTSSAMMNTSLTSESVSVGPSLPPGPQKNIYTCDLCK